MEYCFRCSKVIHESKMILVEDKDLKYKRTYCCWSCVLRDIYDGVVYERRPIHL